MLDLYWDENGIDPYGRNVDGRLALTQACIRRLTTESGTNATELIYEESYGTPISRFLNMNPTNDNIIIAEAAIVAEIQKDPRVQGCSVSFSQPNGRITDVTIRIKDEEGYFHLNFKVDKYDENGVFMPTIKKEEQYSWTVTDAASLKLPENILRLNLILQNTSERVGVFYRWGSAPSVNSMVIPPMQQLEFPNNGLALYLKAPSGETAVIKASELLG